MAGLRIVDPHMHLWDLGRHYYSWLQDDPLPHNPAGDTSGIAGRDYRLDDYFADAKGWNVVGLVHVECGLPPQDQLSETDWLQGMAREHGFPQAIVAGANLDSPDLEARLSAQAERPNVRGVRQIINWHLDPAKTYQDRDLLQDPAWRAGFGRLAAYGLSFDLQIYPSQMADAARLAAAHAETPIILNHMGMPVDRGEAELALWRDGMRRLAEEPNVSVKISGVGIADRSWTPESIRPFVLQTIELFGVDRCMFASDFPVDRVHGSFSRHFEAYDEITRGFSEDERRKLFVETAVRVYRLAL